jgi:GSH-dependent disulfide-bond oxidoreductase
MLTRSRLLYSLMHHCTVSQNGQKVTIALEELGLKYDAHFIDILGGDQFSSGFVAVNPNSKIPSMVDHEGPGGKPINLFESASILLHLAEKTGKLIPKVR